jgi:hypothetical protein
MWWNRECGLYSFICLIVAVCGEVLCIINNDGWVYMLGFAAAVLIVLIAGLWMFESIYKKVRYVRSETENITHSGKAETSDTEASKSLEKQAQTDKKKFDRLDERYREGEVGKLVNSVAELYSMLVEAEQKQLREKEFMRDLISDISHQLKTPIATLTVFNDIFLNDDGTMEEAQKKDMLLQSERQLERMKWLIQAMLQLARIEAESITFGREQINVRTLFESCANMLRFKADEKTLSFTFEGETDICIIGDREWLQEALVNVIKNAIEYAPEGSSIILGSRQTPIATKLYVRDFGPGIEEKDRINIFKRFYRAGRNDVNPNSVGIGLALSKSIVEGCGGRIMVESRHISDCKHGEKSYTEMIIIF